MTPNKIIRIFNALASVDPFAWGIVGLSVILVGVIALIRQQAWFIQGDESTRKIVVAILSTFATAPHKF